MDRTTQRLRVIRHLKDYGTITSIEAFQEYGITRLSSVIERMRKSGIAVNTEMVSGENRYGETVRYGKYSLVEEKGNEMRTL